MDQEASQPDDHKRKRDAPLAENLPNHPGIGSADFKRQRGDALENEPRHAGNGFTPSPIPRNWEPPLPPAQGFFHGAKDFVIENSIMTDVQGDVIFQFDGPPTEEFKFMFTQHMEGLVTVKDLDKIAAEMKEHSLSQAIKDLPRASAAYNDYTSSKRRRTICFQNTRQALLKEIALSLTSADGPRAYLLFGIAGVGKSTVAQTVAERTDNLRLLGASFFFSRDEVDRRTAEKFFTSIAFQLCLYDKQFAAAIGAVLTHERGTGAISRDPQEQLKVLIIEPLRDISRSRSLPTVIVVDALDECDVEDGPAILMALNQLIHDLPSFKVVLTTRPQPHLHYLLRQPVAHQAFRMEDIEQKVVEGDIRLYLEYNLSQDQVHSRLPMLPQRWTANDKEISSLVRAAGGLFVIASTAILYLLDAVAYNPASRMRTLQAELSRDRTPFNTLRSFYTVILRNAVPLGCDRDIVDRYQAVIGAIVLIEDPLPIGVLAKLIGTMEDDIRATLVNLQSVISLRQNGIPLVYHKSFPDYVTDEERCRDNDLHIRPRDHHTRLATRCLHVMNERLIFNILGLGGVSQYLNNDEVLGQGTDNLQRKIPRELQYASVHWANHLVQADLSDSNLMAELETFTREHLLHWLEALSWTHKLNTTHVSLSATLKVQILSSEMRNLFYDVLRFVSKDFEKIAENALHIYHSALPFTPTKTLLYQKYRHQLLSCQVEGGPAQWDMLLSEKQHGQGKVFRVAFAKDNSQFASWDEGNLKLWDGASGAPIRSFGGTQITLADDFSILAMPQGGSVTMYSTSSGTPLASFDHSSMVVKVVISFNGSRLAAGLQNGKIRIWNVERGVYIANLDDYSDGPLKFSPRGHTLAFASNDRINLWKGGRVAARLEHGPQKPVGFVFSLDSTRLATMAKKDNTRSLRLWNAKNGEFIAAVEVVGDLFAISADGSLIVTGRWNRVELWGGDALTLVHTIRVADDLRSVDLSGDVLAVASTSKMMLYDVKSKACTAIVQVRSATSLTFSPDGARLAAGNKFGVVHLWDVPSIKTSASASGDPPSRISALALSPDCSRLASSYEDRFFKLWDTTHMERAIVDIKHPSECVAALAFSPDGEQLASGSKKAGLKFWNGRDGSPTGIVEHSFSADLTSLVFSGNLLAAATIYDITLWDRISLHLIHTIDNGSYSLSFSLDGSVLASSNVYKITVWDTENFSVTATFTVNTLIQTLLPSPDGSKLVAHGRCFYLCDIVNKVMIGANNEDLSWAPQMNGVPVSWDGFVRDLNRDRDRLVGWFSASRRSVPVMWIPRSFRVIRFVSHSSTFVLGCTDGRILLIRPRTRY